MNDVISSEIVVVINMDCCEFLFLIHGYVISFEIVPIEHLFFFWSED